VRTELKANRACFGAGAMDPSHDCGSPYGSKLLTSPAYAKADVTAGIRECLNWPPFKSQPISCKRGDTTNPGAKIALFGNSHAGQWTEALDRIGDSHGWEVDTYIVGACFSSIEPQAADCTKITNDVIHRISNGHYRAVVFATYDDHGSTASEYRTTINALTASGAHVLVIRDTPAPWDQNNEPADCVSRHLADLSACDGAPSEWIRPDPLFAAASEASGSNSPVSTVDLNKLLCTQTACPSVIGGVIVFSDYNHLSKTFSRTLAPYLEPAVLEAMRVR
jgi:hypothetical protein